ncbi:hypothetical protein DERP_014436 [Dermatophagoides pteronyssinus]|uniref:Uncharacterized protein n=1 Tax=Dermatophagoides pteronyssinus TaxID=6956 RepID=A0ABQ8IVS5_DERPT|nr:hypothetical protein DERP_014436 [Dermatophagoides pteronyssinus]
MNNKFYILLYDQEISSENLSISLHHHYHPEKISNQFIYSSHAVIYLFINLLEHDFDDESVIRTI